MIEMLKQYLTERGAFNGSLPGYITDMTNSVTGQLPYKMKLSIAVSEIVLFTSQFSRHIELEDKTLVPVNAITFVLASSGFSKDRTASGMRKCFDDGYKVIDEKRKDYAVERAIAQATAVGKQDPTEPHSYREFYHDPRPLFVATSTEEGLVSHINDLEKDGLGAAYLYVGELGSELQSNANIVNNIRLWSEIYDLGTKEVKIIKSRESQAKEIKKMAVNGLFIGSHDNILYDESVKQRFKLEFTTKLARRSFFNFNPEEAVKRHYSSVEEMITVEREEEKQAYENTLKINQMSKDIAEYNFRNNTKQPILESEEAHDLFIAYKRYNEELSDSMSKLFPISKLVRKHAQWRALKLAAAFALFAKHSKITAEDYIHAITYVEMLDTDMMMFEDEFRKESYEQFVDYMHFVAENGKSSISIHKLRKMGYIPTSGNSEPRIKELIKLAASYDKSGIYAFEENDVTYEEMIRTDVVGASFLPMSYPGLDKAKTKAERDAIKQRAAKNSATGYEYAETEFAQLDKLLSLDMAYSPFRFKDGVRGKDNIASGTKWLVLDIDDSTITDEECHFILQDINHHIARTSEAENPFKFRALIELDAIVDVSDTVWKRFVSMASASLGLKADPLPQSQIFYAYAGREILSVVDKAPLEVHDFVMLATSADSEKETAKPKLTKAVMTEQLSNPMDTFMYAYEAPNGAGSRNMIRAAYHAKDLGATVDDIISLVHDINNYWVSPMDQTRLENTIISQIRRW